MPSKFRRRRSYGRLIRNLPEAARAELADVLQDVAPAVRSTMLARVPRRSGALAAAIAVKVYPRTLRLRAGLLTRARARRLFYARILEYGRKAQTVNVRRRTPSGGRVAYVMRVAPIAAGRFIRGAMPELQTQLRVRLKEIWARILQQASRGMGND